MLHFLLFIGTYCGGLFYALTSVPTFAFVVYQAVYFFNPTSRWWGYLAPSIPYSLLSVVFMMLVFVKSFKLHNQNKLLAAPQFKWVYLSVILYGITSLYAVNYGHNEALVNYVKLVIIISLAYKICDTDKKLDYILYGYIFGAWYISFLTFQIGRNSGDRVEGIGTVDSPDSNGIALAIAPSLVLSLYYYWISQNKVIKGLFVIAAVFILNAIVLINSRGAFLGVAVSVSFFMWFMWFAKVRVKYQRGTVIAIMILGLLGAVKIVDESFINRMFTITTVSKIDKTEQETGSTRTAFWVAAWDMAKDYPLGNGYRGFNYYAPFYIPANINTGAHRNRSVHSTWFEVLSEVGYLGLLFFILMITSCFKALKKCKIKLQQDEKLKEFYKVLAIQAALMSFLVSMSFVNRMRSEVLYWLILFSACAYNIYVIKPEKDKSHDK